MSKQIDDAEYQSGMRAFNEGTTLRSIVDLFITAKKEPDETKAISFALGFADAFLDKLRGIER